ncbi:hypothetical protein AMS68_000693 [Peltaster fructicola]|uniref:HSF-type DNA-binding domain-containing protein n=1 Tax=Peltaster fructicola TaxID=286661 RepID=A0A6H0XKE6_9PEZI|nr:hypothetical protein AMS68_000693 [Peltaster fructicola]
MSESDDAMDVTPPATTNMGPPPSTSTAEASQEGQPSNGLPVGAAAAAQQPKIVQTAFIHKLYNMLEDQTIQHLISWSGSNESFVMSPSSEFSKVLAQYFKHTNISSFVRQLNMYGFHKVSDVFHTGSPDSPLWEFKHGGGNFKRGDLVGLREIKRRASRHALIHRDSFSTTPKMPVPAQIPGPPTEPMPDPIEARIGALEWQQQDLFSRLHRTEDAYSALTAKCHALLEGLNRCYGWNKDLTASLSTILPASETQVHKDLAAMQQEIARGIDTLRAVDEQHNPFNHRQTLFPGNLNDGSLLSPRQRPFDESRRPSLQNIGRPSSFRSVVPGHLQASPRRFGSFGGGNGAFSPSTRASYALPPPAPQVVQPPPPPPPPQHPLARTQSPPPNLSRRHTSADIRTQGWQGGQMPGPYNPASSPYASGQNSTAWPSSPRAPPADQQLRDALASYELPRGPQAGSRQASPPAAPDAGPPIFTNSFVSTSTYANNSNEAGWQLPGQKYPYKTNLDTPGPPTRRSSMASNVHSLLNPADTAEREGEDEGSDDRKRKRVV